MPIAQHAGIRQIVRRGRSAVLPANNMIDLVRETGVVFMDQAVFTAVIRAPGTTSKRRTVECTDIAYSTP